LIFVIVILGILSAVAVPKMMGVSAKAEVGVCKSFYSSLNRTVSPALWSNMAIDGQNAATAYHIDRIKEQIDVDAKCLKADGGEAALVAMATDGTAYDVVIDGKTYNVTGTKADSSNAATWKWPASATVAAE